MYVGPVSGLRLVGVLVVVVCSMGSSFVLAFTSIHMPRLGCLGRRHMTDALPPSLH
jgi:hypothetical protein